MIINRSTTKVLFFSAVIVMALSCKDDNIKRDFYRNGNVEHEYTLLNGRYEGPFKVYDENGTLREVHVYSKGVKIDSSVFYSKNGELQGVDLYLGGDSLYRKIFDSIHHEGYVNKQDILTGKWKFFDSIGNIREICEFLDIKGSTHLNQNWLFNTDGDTLPPSDKSSYYSLRFYQDTISLKDCATGLVDLYDPLFDKNDPDIMVVLPKNGSANFNGDFSNVDEVETDTIYNLNIEYHYRKEAQKAGLPSGDYSTLAFFGRYFTTPGTKKFRGIIVEFYNVDPDSVAADGMRSYKHKKYFEHTVFVKDTVEQK